MCLLVLLNKKGDEIVVANIQFFGKLKMTLSFAFCCRFQEEKSGTP